MPRISIRVAKKGPAEKAGSILSRRKINGIKEPSITEVRTINPREKLTIKLWPTFPELYQTRTNDVRPKMLPSMSAMLNSRLKNLKIFALRISPEAIP